MFYGQVVDDKRGDLGVFSLEYKLTKGSKNLTPIEKIKESRTRESIKILNDRVENYRYKI